MRRITIRNKTGASRTEARICDALLDDDGGLSLEFKTAKMKEPVTIPWDSFLREINRIKKKN